LATNNLDYCACFRIYQIIDGRKINARAGRIQRGGCESSRVDCLDTSGQWS
jgi:hypothetical protein